MCGNISSSDVDNAFRCSTAMDVVFINDGSSSIDDDDYVRARNFHKEFMSRFKMDFDLMRMGVVQFSDNAGDSCTAQFRESAGDDGKSKIVLKGVQER